MDERKYIIKHIFSFRSNILPNLFELCQFHGFAKLKSVFKVLKENSANAAFKLVKNVYER